MPFIKGGKYGRQPINLTEQQIKYAVANTKSNQAAAKFLNISNITWKKYASMYINSETGETYYESHKNRSGYGISKGGLRRYGKYGLQEILEGKYPNYDPKNLKKRIIRAGVVLEECAICGFSERRVLDYTVPLVLEFIDGDKTNHRLENLRLLCYNHYYLMVGNITGVNKKLSLVGY